MILSKKTLVDSVVKYKVLELLIHTLAELEACIPQVLDALGVDALAAWNQLSPNEIRHTEALA